MQALAQKVFTTNNANFEKSVWQVFKFQAQNSTIYKNYISALGINPLSIQHIQQIPFLPISFFLDLSDFRNLLRPNYEPQ